MRFLVDTSALVQIQKGQVDVAWDQAVERGMLVLCEPVLAETLMLADAKGYERIEDRLCRTYPWAAVPDDIWAMVGAIRRELAPHSAHRGLPVGDLVVASMAVQLRLEVLHEDADFETVARFVPELRQRRIGVGPD